MAELQIGGVRHEAGLLAQLARGGSIEWFATVHGTAGRLCQPSFQPGVFDEGQVIRGSFAEVSGLDVEVTPIEYRTGSEDITVRKLPGLRKFSNITLKRGIIGDLAFWTGTKSVLDGHVLRADGTITLLDEGLQPVLRWSSGGHGRAGGWGRR